MQGFIMYIPQLTLPTMNIKNCISHQESLNHVNIILDFIFNNFFCLSLLCLSLNSELQIPFIPSQFIH